MGIKPPVRTSAPGCPREFSAALAVNVFVLGEIAHGAIGEFADAVAMRIVCGDGQVVVADMLDKSRRELFAGLATRPTLALEIIARLFFGGLRLAVTFVLPVFVHALEP